MTVEKLQAIATNNESTEEDHIWIANLLRRCGFPLAKCVCGIVYFEGQGTIEYPPASIQEVADMILRAKGVTANAN